jgi:hypothetical protein
MELQFQPNFGGVDVNTIDAFERENDLKLPNDYRQFLLRHNGGRPEPAGTCLLKCINERVLVDMLFGLSTEEPDLDIRRWTKQFGSGLPPGCFIIGNVGGLLFVLCVRGETGVFCWDEMRELEPSEETEDGKLYPIAETFTEFLHSLEPIE